MRIRDNKKRQTRTTNKMRKPTKDETYIRKLNKN